MATDLIARDAADQAARLARSKGPLAAAGRLLAGARRGVTPINTVMASPPTLTQAASDGATSTLVTTEAPLTGGRFQSGNPLHVTLVGGPGHAQGGFVGNRLAVVTRQTVGTRVGGHGSGVAFGTYAGSVEVSIRANGGRVIFYVTDLATGIRARVSAADIAATYNAANWYRLDFGSRGLRIVEVYAANTSNIYGINVPTTDSIWPVEINQPRVLVIGDSYIEGSINDATLGLKLATADWIGACLGCQNPIGNGVGSTGVIATAGAGALQNFAGRLAAGDFDQARIGDMDAVIVWGSINDYNTTNGGVSDDTAFASAATAFFRAIMARQPNALILATGPETPNAGPPTQARFDATKAAFAAAAAGDPRCLYLDNGPTGQNWMFGNGASGINGAIVGADNIHPNAAGAQYLGQRTATAALAAVRAAYGL